MSLPAPTSHPSAPQPLIWAGSRLLAPLGARLAPCQPSKHSHLPVGRHAPWKLHSAGHAAPQSAPKYGGSTRTCHCCRPRAQSTHGGIRESRSSSPTSRPRRGSVVDARTAAGAAIGAGSRLAAVANPPLIAEAYIRPGFTRRVGSITHSPRPWHSAPSAARIHEGSESSPHRVGTLAGGGPGGGARETWTAEAAAWAASSPPPQPERTNTPSQLCRHHFQQLLTHSSRLQSSPEKPAGQ